MNESRVGLKPPTSGAGQTGSDVSAAGISRRRALTWITGLGLSSVTLARALAAEAERAPLDKEAIARAEWISGVTLDDDQRQRLVRSVDRMHEQLRQLREVEIDADVAPCLQFVPYPDAYKTSSEVEASGSGKAESSANSVRPRNSEFAALPTDPIEIAFAPIAVLGAMLRSQKITSVQLTEMFLKRLEEHGPTLNCTVTLTPELAMQQAKQADQELTAGKDRGPLHGIPWGAKDLNAVEGYKPTWGAEPDKEQIRPGTATVAKRLQDAGAVLVAKLTLGAIAMGDDWFGGRTKNPWNVEQGSSGSSAGSAAATAAGLVPFAIGSETLGSIVSPSRRCGTTGLRPTFGRVSRAGCMPLAWSFDKLGPICRSVEDCALVFGAIAGSDGLDPSVNDHPFQWPATSDIQALKVGFTGEDDDRPELQTLKKLGVNLVNITLPSELPLGALTMMLDVESASMFYDLWKDGNTEGLFRWPSIWQTAAFVPAIDYVRAARIRTILMRQMETVMEQVDLYVGGNDLVLTNLTGHPTVVMPYREGKADKANGQPGAITFTGKMHGEAVLLAVAEAFQNETGDHLPRPPQFAGITLSSESAE